LCSPSFPPCCIWFCIFLSCVFQVIRLHVHRLHCGQCLQSSLYVRRSLRYGYDFHERRNLTRARWTTSTHTDKNSALGTVNKIRRHIDLSWSSAETQSDSGLPKSARTLSNSSADKVISSFIRFELNWTAVCLLSVVSSDRLDANDAFHCSLQTFWTR